MFRLEHAFRLVNAALAEQQHLPTRRQRPRDGVPLLQCDIEQIGHGRIVTVASRIGTSREGEAAEGRR